MKRQSRVSVYSVHDTTQETSHRLHGSFFPWVFLLKKLFRREIVHLLIRSPFVTGLHGKGVTHLVSCRFSLHIVHVLYPVMSNCMSTRRRRFLGSSTTTIISNWTLLQELNLLNECFVIGWVLLTIYVAHSHFCLKYLSITVSPWYEKSTFTFRCLYRRNWFYSTNRRVSLGWRGQRGNYTVTVTRHDACCYKEMR